MPANFVVRQVQPLIWQGSPSGNKLGWAKTHVDYIYCVFADCLYSVFDYIRQYIV